MGAFEHLRNPDFTNLDDLHTILSDDHLVVLPGIFDSNQQNPNLRVTISSPNSKTLYDFIKVDTDTYILKVHQVGN